MQRSPIVGKKKQARKPRLFYPSRQETMTNVESTIYDSIVNQKGGRQQTNEIVIAYR